MITTFTVALLRQVRLNLYRNRLWHCGLHWVRSPIWRGPQNRCCRRSTKQAATNKIGFETISKHTIFIIMRLIYITIRKTPNRKIRKTVVWGGECSALCGSFVAGASTKWHQEEHRASETTHYGSANQHRLHLWGWLQWQQSQSSWTFTSYGWTEGCSWLTIFGLLGACCWHLQKMQLLSQGPLSEWSELHLLPLIPWPAQGQSCWETWGPAFPWCQLPNHAIHGWGDVWDDLFGDGHDDAADAIPTGGPSTWIGHFTLHPTGDTCLEGWGFGTAIYRNPKSTLLGFYRLLSHGANECHLPGEAVEMWHLTFAFHWFFLMLT